MTYLVELNHIRVSDFFQYFDLSGDPIYVLPVLDPRLFQNLDRHALLGQNVLGHLHLAERSLTQRLS